MVSVDLVNGAKHALAYRKTPSEIFHRCSIGFLLVCFLDHQGVYHGSQPIHKLVEIHARRIFPAIRCPVIFRQAEEIVKLRLDRCIDTSESPCKRGGERFGCIHSDGSSSLRGPESQSKIRQQREEQDREPTDLIFVNDRSSSTQATSRCSKLPTICAICERLDVCSARLAILALM